MRLLRGRRLVGCQTLVLFLWGGAVRRSEDSALCELSEELGLGKRGLRVHAKFEVGVGGKFLLAQEPRLHDRQLLGCREKTLCGREAAKAESVARDGIR